MVLAPQSICWPPLRLEKRYPYWNETEPISLALVHDTALSTAHIISVALVKPNTTYIVWYLICFIHASTNNIVHGMICMLYKIFISTRISVTWLETSLSIFNLYLWITRTFLFVGLEYLLASNTTVLITHFGNPAFCNSALQEVALLTYLRIRILNMNIPFNAPPASNQPCLSIPA